MKKIVMMRLLHRSIYRRSLGFSTAVATTINHHFLRHFHPSLSSPKLPTFDCRPPFAMGIGSTRSISDPEIEIVFKDLMASSWDELPDTVIHDANKALSKNTDDKAGQEALANDFRAAEANVKPILDEFSNALRRAHQRYIAYLDSFESDEGYLRKKVETELGTRMIHLKMRCSGIGSEWGKVTVLGTSGLSGSYVEHRA